MEASEQIWEKCQMLVPSPIETGSSITAVEYAVYFTLVFQKIEK